MLLAPQRQQAPPQQQQQQHPVHSTTPTRTPTTQAQHNNQQQQQQHRQQINYIAYKDRPHSKITQCITGLFCIQHIPKKEQTRSDLLVTLSKSC